MAHVSDGVLQAYLDGELEPTERTAVASHLGACARCAAELEVLRAASEHFADALGAVDRPAPVTWAHKAVRRRARRRRAPGGLPRTFLRAAVLILGFAGAASAALPDSPVRAWALRAWHGVTAALSDPAPASGAPEAEAPEAGAPEPQPAGIAIAPADGGAVVTLDAPAPGTRIRVRFGDGGRVVVSSSAGAQDVRFRTGPGRVAVVNSGPGAVTVEFPRSLSRAVVEVDGQPYLVKEGTDVHMLAPPRDTAGAEFVFQVQR